LVAVGAYACCLAVTSSSPSSGNFVGPAVRVAPDSVRAPARGQAGTMPQTVMLARGGADSDADSVEVSGFAGFVVGLSLLPHVIFALVVAFGIAAQGQSFALGPYGLELISCSTTVGLTLWSLGSFVQRGRGLPAGPLGFLGLAEGLSYLACLGLAIATVASYARGGVKISVPSLPAVPSIPAIKAPDFKAPDIKVPSFKAPDIKVPDFKAPDIKVPEFKAPDIKVPEFKAPDIKVPEFKAPAIKVPEFKAPDIKIPDIKVPEVKVPELPKPKPAEPEKPKPAPKPAPEPEKPKPAPKPAPEPEKPKPAPEPKKEAKKESTPDYASLFD